MLFLQPVVVSDAHAADRTPAAEVRPAERRAHESPVWQPAWGALLAQSSMDQRSPFGANAPDNNDVTPQRMPAHQPDDTPSSLPSTSAGDKAASTDDTNGSSSTSTPAPAASTPPASLAPAPDMISFVGKKKPA